jgi:hypothetical protein
VGKRSNFERKPRDYYPTPLEAVVPLISHLPDSFTFAEPCAGDGRLADHLIKLSNAKASAVLLSDIEPQRSDVEKRDALDIVVPRKTDLIITNPPWDRKILHPMIEHFSQQKPTWLLFDANWMFTKQATPYLKYCKKIVTIGRVKWIEDSAMSGKDDSCWYLFEKSWFGTTQFYGRQQ